MFWVMDPGRGTVFYVVLCCHTYLCLDAESPENLHAQHRRMCQPLGTPCGEFLESSCFFGLRGHLLWYWSLQQSRLAAPLRDILHCHSRLVRRWITLQHLTNPCEWSARVSMLAFINRGSSGGHGATPVWWT